MAFEVVEIISRKAQDTETGVKAGLQKIGKGKAKLVINMTPAAFAQTGFSPDDRFQLLIGTEADHGLIRLQKNKTGNVRVQERSYSRGGAGFEFRLGYRPEFVDRPERAMSVNCEKIDLATIEIVLPPWADETKPGAKVKVQALPAPDIAARREQERLAQEAAAAEQRRRQAELDEVAEIARREALASFKGDIDAFSISVTESEGAVLRRLIAAKGKIVTREALMMAVYGHSDDAPDAKIIDVFMSKLRPKLPASVTISTAHGQGWAINGQVERLFREETAA